MAVTKQIVTLILVQYLAGLWTLPHHNLNIVLYTTGPATAVITHCVHKCTTLSIVFFQKLYENFSLSRVVLFIFQNFSQSDLLLTDVIRRKVSCKVAAFDKQCGS